MFNMYVALLFTATPLLHVTLLHNERNLKKSSVLEMTIKISTGFMRLLNCVDVTLLWYILSMYS